MFRPDGREASTSAAKAVNFREAHIAALKRCATQKQKAKQRQQSGSKCTRRESTPFSGLL
jgi:hypothetical protein